MVEHSMDLRSVRKQILVKNRIFHHDQNGILSVQNKKGKKCFDLHIYSIINMQYFFTSIPYIVNDETNYLDTVYPLVSLSDFSELLALRFS